MTVIEGQRRTYTEEQWRKVIRTGFPKGLPSKASEADEIARILDAQEVRLISAVDAHRIARDEMRKMREEAKAEK